MSIITEYPIWFITLCMLAGLVYAGALYFRDKFNRTYGSRLAGLLGALRFSAITVLCFFLLKPLIKTIDREVEKPIIVIAQDNSESIGATGKTEYYKNEYLAKLRKVKEQLGDDYEVVEYAFGHQVSEGLDSISFNEKQTDFTALFRTLANNYSGRNLGALVLASDGIYNKGSNPLYGYQKLNAPVYTIALGDTTVYRDVLIREVNANRLAYLNNRFPIAVTIEGRKTAGETVNVTLSTKGNVVFSESITFSGDRSFKNLEIFQEATSIGLQKYTLQVTSVSNELTILNNRKDFFIDVLDSRQKVLLLAASPHPDVNALREAISNNDAYSVDTKLASNFSGNLSEYNLVIFHQLPSMNGQGSTLVKNALNGGINSLFIWGANTDFRTFNELNTGFALNDYRTTSTEVYSSLMEGFTLFQTDEVTEGLIQNLPPLSIPFGSFSNSNGASIFVQQRVGQILTGKPLIAFNRINETKVGLIAGEGVWRWRISAFRQFESHENFDALITKMVQYLAAKEDKSLFRVTGAGDFAENEAIVFNAELYNASYEPILDKEIKMSITDETGKEFSFAFSTTDGRYKLNAGSLPVGNYRYLATTVSEGLTLKENGEFSVSPLQAELTNLVADHRMLQQLANENDGQLLSENEVDKIADIIRARKDIISVSYENKQLDDLINFHWLLLIVLLLLSAEWLLRKRAGTY